MKFTSTLAPLAAVAMLATSGSAQVITQHGYTCLDASYTPTGVFSHYGCGVGIVDAQFGIPFTASWCDTAQGVKDLCNPNQVVQQQQPQQWVGVPPPIAVSRRTAAIPTRRTGANAAATFGDKTIVPAAGATLADMEQALGQLLDAGILDSNLNINNGSRRRNLLQANTQSPDEMAANFLNIVYQLGLIPIPNNIQPAFATTYQPSNNVNAPARRQAASTTSAPALPAPGSVDDMISAIGDLQGAGVLDSNLNLRA